MKVQIHVIADFVLPQATPALIQVEPREIPSVQVVEHSALRVTPPADIHAYTDLYGNACRRLLCAQGDARIEYSAMVTFPDDQAAPAQLSQCDPMLLPPETLHYTVPSRYCQSDLLAKMAEDEFAGVDAGSLRVQAICDWINKRITYQYSVSNSNTSAYDTAAQRIGVCRDFAHLGIAFCRALDMPARYVSGYCLGLQPPDFHAWFQVYLGGQWVNFDATDSAPRAALVAVSIGRDAADCPWSTFYGSGEVRSVSVDVRDDHPRT